MKKTLEITSPNAMSPFRKKVSKMDARGSILEGFGVTLGSLLAPNDHPETLREGPGEREEF